MALYYARTDPTWAATRERPPPLAEMPHMW